MREREIESERDIARGAAMPLLLVPPFLWKNSYKGLWVIRECFYAVRRRKGFFFAIKSERER